ncbi:hypothetical protein ACWV95_35575 [Streptomyces albus]
MDSIASRHRRIRIDRRAEDVHAYASGPVDLPSWARGYRDTSERSGDRWIAASSPGSRRCRRTAGGGAAGS